MNITFGISSLCLVTLGSEVPCLISITTGNVHLFSKASEKHAPEFSTDLVPFDIVVNMDDTDFACLPSASGNKLATKKTLVNSPFSFRTAFVTFVALGAFLVFFIGPLTRCFTWCWTDVFPFV